MMVQEWKHGWFWNTCFFLGVFFLFILFFAFTKYDQQQIPLKIGKFIYDSRYGKKKEIKTTYSSNKCLCSFGENIFLTE